MTITLRLVLASGFVTFLAGCDALEPYDRAGAWRPTGASASNLAAMVANPEDLVHGRGTDAADGALSAAAVDRLRRDKVKALLDGNSLSSASPSAAAGLSAN